MSDKITSSPTHDDVRPAGDGRAASAYGFEVVQSDRELEALRLEWSELFSRSASQNPFVHPAWMLPWLRHFVPDPADRHVISVRRAGELVAVVPLRRQRQGIGPLRARTLQLAGGSPRSNDRLTEMSEVLALPAERQRIMRAVVRHLASGVEEWDWLGVTISADEAWFETAWLPEAWQRAGANIVHKVRPAIRRAAAPVDVGGAAAEAKQAGGAASQQESARRDGRGPAPIRRTGAWVRRRR